MANSQASRTSEMQDWIPVSLVIVLLLARSWFLTPFPTMGREQLILNIAVHYFVYIAGITCAIAFFLLDGLGHEIPQLQEWLPRILVVTVILDFTTPLQSIPTFSLLELLFYLLVLILLSHFLFGPSQFFSNLNRPMPLAALLALITFWFIAESYPKGYPIPEFSGTTFLRTFLRPEVLTFILVLLMFTAIVSLVQKHTWLASRRKLVLLIAAGSAALVSTLNLRYPLPFSTRFFCMFLFFFSSPVYDNNLELGVRRLAEFAFAVTLLSVYFDMNSVDITRALVEASKYKEMIGPWGSATVAAISLVSGIYTLFTFHRSRRTIRGHQEEHVHTEEDV